MKQTKKLTRKGKRAKFKTIKNWVRIKEEEQRKSEAKKLNAELNAD